jgi:hypothetical protein
MQAMFTGPNGRMVPGGIPPFAALPNQLVQQKKEIEKLQEKKKKREKMKKNKLKEMLLLLDLGDGEEESDDEPVIIQDVEPKADKTPKSIILINNQFYRKNKKN